MHFRFSNKNKNKNFVFDYFQRDKELAERFCLKPPSEYNYLNQVTIINVYPAHGKVFNLVK